MITHLRWLILYDENRVETKRELQYWDDNLEKWVDVVVWEFNESQYDPKCESPYL
jgi:hypothetical protein